MIAGSYRHLAHNWRRLSPTQLVGTEIHTLNSPPKKGQGEISISIRIMQSRLIVKEER